MKLLVINPNTTAAMTDSIVAQARAFANVGTEIDVASPEWGTPAIESHFDEQLGALGILQIIAGCGSNYDGFAIACFGDPGLYAARELATAPVVGIGEAAMLLACAVAHQFSVVTTLARAKPLLWDMIKRYGLAERCASVRATDLPVLELSNDVEHVRARVTEEAHRAVVEDGAEAICLGCSGMASLDMDLRRSLNIPVLDGVAASVKLLEALVGYGLCTSRVGGFAAPMVDRVHGDVAMLAPFSALGHV